MSIECMFTLHRVQCIVLLGVRWRKVYFSHLQRIGLYHSGQRIDFHHALHLHLERYEQLAATMKCIDEVFAETRLRYLLVTKIRNNVLLCQRRSRRSLGSIKEYV